MGGTLLPRANLIRFWGKGREIFVRSVLNGSGLPEATVEFLAEVGLPLRPARLIGALGITIEVSGGVLPRIPDARSVPSAVQHKLASFRRFGSCDNADLCLNPRGEVLRVEVVPGLRWGYEDRVMNGGIEEFVDFLYVLEQNADSLAAAADTPDFSGLLGGVEAVLSRIEPSAMNDDGWWPAVLEDMRV